MPPTPFCPECRSQEISWVELSGQGTVYSYTVVSRAIFNGMEDCLPYVPAVVELADAGGVRLITNIVDAPIDAIAVDAPVTVVFDDLATGTSIPRFRLAPERARNDPASGETYANGKIAVMKPWAMWDVPFFDAAHRDFAHQLAQWPVPGAGTEPHDMATAARALTAALSERGLLDIVVPPGAESGKAKIDVRAMCLAREVLSYSSVFADAIFAMQGIGTAAIWLFGSAELREQYLPAARAGKTIAALAISEPEAGSDVAAMTTSATRDGKDYVLSGRKTWISNAGFADHYIVLARTVEAPGARGISAFLVDADTPGLRAGEPIDFIAPHPAASLQFDECRVPARRMIGAPGQGFKAAMATLDLFRASVGAAALGAGRRALDETLSRVTTRRMFGKTMAEMDGVQTRLADMLTDLEIAALAVYRAAWTKDVSGARCTREVSMSKLVATEAAQRIVDAAVQLFGGAGVERGGIIEQLYREVRPMRIYEGASEVHKLIIARDLIAARQT